MGGLTHYIYTSTATSELAPERLVELLEQARALNEARDITGMLLYSDKNFFQVLEGPADAVEGCYARIEHDPRHAHVTRIISEPITRRSFADWTMGFAELTPGMLRQIEGLNDFFAGGSCFDALDGGRAKMLLSAFAEGRWHATLSGRPLPRKRT